MPNPRSNAARALRIGAILLALGTGLMGHPSHARVNDATASAGEEPAAARSPAVPSDVQPLRAGAPGHATAPYETSSWQGQSRDTARPDRSVDDASAVNMLLLALCLPTMAALMVIRRNSVVE